MFTPEWPRRLLCLSLCLPAGMALACGPDFPLRLLDNRAQSMTDLPESNFQFEVNRLGQAIAGLKNTTDNTLTPYWDGQNNAPYLELRDKVEQSELTPEQQARVTQLRSLTDAHQAEVQGADLPAELRLYTAGAVAFKMGDYSLASDYFSQVLALPADQRRLRSTWAAYSMGRALVAVGSQASSDEAVVVQIDYTALARRAFQQTRDLSIEGYSDPLELGVASLGEEALLLKNAGDWNGAIALYASQSKAGSNTGYSSLKDVVAEISSMPAAQQKVVLAQKPVQALVTAYLLSRVGWSFDEQSPPDKRLTQALQAATRDSLDNSDRLAALSYQSADYAGAKRFLEHAGDTGLAWWLRAKLALRDGDKVAATSAYAKAAQAFPQDESWGSRRSPDWDWETVQPKCRVEGESAILALERGDYLQAFDQLYRSNGIYWSDAATVAERVLTLAELKNYVDTQVPAPPAATQHDRDNYVQRPVAAQLRELLGRRLLREGQYEAAAAYFDTPELQQAARDYAGDRHDAKARWTATGKAEALYAAAKLARVQGMELLGYEMAPDYHSLGGYFSLGPVELTPGPLLSTGEIARQQATVAQPDKRYHYRWVAAGLANDAADLLPHSSQAFAAVLCTAAGWVRGDEAESRLYRRYVDQGPYVPWAENFGQQCEEPDFGSANKRYVGQFSEQIRSVLRPFKTAVLIGAGLVIAGLGFVWLRRRKR